VSRYEEGVQTYRDNRGEVINGKSLCGGKSEGDKIVLPREESPGERKSFGPWKNARATERTWSSDTKWGKDVTLKEKRYSDRGWKLGK